MRRDQSGKILRDFKSNAGKTRGATKWAIVAISASVALGAIDLIGNAYPSAAGQSLSGQDVEGKSDESSTSQDEAPQKPVGKSGHGFPSTASEYAKLIEPELGVPPQIVLDECVEIPLYVDGVQRYGNLGRDLDNPSFLGKATVSGSVLQRYEGRTADGKPLPDVVWVAFGRNSSNHQEKFVGSVQMIGYHRKTGATAFFESGDDKVAQWVRQDIGTLRMRGTLPHVDEPENFNRAFRTPGTAQCVQCHQNDPFITNDFITAAKMPGTDEPVIPILDGDSPYHVIGGEKWDMRTIHIKGNACFDCHRVGMSTMTMFMENGWDPNAHMPPHDPGSLKDDLRDLLEAWRTGPENDEDAEWIIPPARGQPSQVVSDEYPHQAAFNKANYSFYGSIDQFEGSKKESETPDLSAFTGKLKALVAEGKLTEAEAKDLYMSVISGDASKDPRPQKQGVKGSDYKVKSLEETQKLSASLPTTSTAGDQEGPVATGFFGWAAEATHRFMDNSHRGEPRLIEGLSFRLDHRDHDSIGRSWENVTIRIAHGNWSSIKYNASEKFELVNEAAVVFSKPWSFPTLMGIPVTEPAEWGGPQNALNFRFDKPFEYNGTDAIYVEFVFAGGKTEDGRPWEGDLPFGFEYYLDSMPEAGGWRDAEKPAGLYRAPRVEAVVSYTAGGQSVWTSSPKGMPYLKWDFRTAGE